MSRDTFQNLILSRDTLSRYSWKGRGYYGFDSHRMRKPSIDEQCVPRILEAQTIQIEAIFVMKHNEMNVIELVVIVPCISVDSGCLMHVCDSGVEIIQ